MNIFTTEYETGSDRLWQNVVAVIELWSSADDVAAKATHHIESQQRWTLIAKLLWFDVKSEPCHAQQYTQTHLHAVCCVYITVLTMN